MTRILAPISMNIFQHVILILTSIVSSPLVHTQSLSAFPSPTHLPTMTATPSPTSIPTPMPTQTPKPTKSPLPTPTPHTVSSQQLDEWFTQYSRTYSVDRQRLFSIAVCESNLHPEATNGVYGGLYQFDTRTWISTRKQMNTDTHADLRFHPEEAIKTAAFLLSTRGHSPWKHCSN
jgi:hypothetical protein